MKLQSNTQESKGSFYIRRIYIVKEKLKAHVLMNTGDFTSESVEVEVDVNKEGWFKPIQQITLIADDVWLREVWVASFEKAEYKNAAICGFEFIEERIFYKEPTDTELMWIMSELGLGLTDIVSVRKVKQFDWERDW